MSFPFLRCLLVAAGAPGLLGTSACHRAAAPAATAATTTCIDPAKVNPQAMCTMDYKPVCGCDGKTYANACGAERAGVRTYAAGPCAAARP